MKMIAAAAIIFLAGFLLFSFTNTKMNNLQLPFGQTKEFTGIVAGYPAVSGNSQTLFLQTSDFGQPVKIYISTSAFPAFEYGDKLKIKSTITRPTNISSFDWVS
ncbi:MAG: hypothetical protein WCP91_02945, partial [Candidatus Berkelbacteria bacterium]